MSRYFTGANPEAVSMGRYGSGRNDYGHFRYGTRMYRFTGRFGGGAAEIRDNEGNLWWIEYTNPVYVEYKKQAAVVLHRQSLKAAKKREELKEQKKKAAALSTMTAFEWRYRLAKEHRLYLKRREYGCGSFVVYEMNCALPDSCIRETKNGKVFRDTEILDLCEPSWICGYSAWKVYTEETIMEVVQKVKEAHAREAKRAMKETIKALDVLG